MGRFNTEMKIIIENNTKEDAAKILGLSMYQINYYINYYALKYKKVTHKFHTEKAKKIINFFNDSDLRDIDIARKVGVTRQYVQYIRTVYEKNNNN